MNASQQDWYCLEGLRSPSREAKLPRGVVSGCQVWLCAGGTSNYWQHLYHHHRAKWLELKNEDGVLTPAGLHQIEQVRDAMAARMAASVNCTKKPSLPAHARVTLDRLTAEWIVDEDQYTNAAAKPGFQKLFNAATDGAYEGCCSKTVQGHVAKLAVEGRAKTSLLHSLVLEAGFRIVVSADLWSKNGVALLGILSHAIVELVDDKGAPVWLMVELLSGAVPCKKYRHTGAYVETATFGELAKTGIDKPTEQIFKAKTDRGSNMIKGYDKLDHDPCTDHLIHTSVGIFYEHPSVSPTLKKGRAVVGSFNSSTIGQSDLADCQKLVGLKEKSLVQDVVTRWAATHAMSNSLRENQAALILYDVEKAKVASDSFKANKYDIEEWQINNQSCALLGGLAAATKILQGKNYPTSNMVLFYMWGCVSSLHANAPTIQAWDGGSIAPSDLHPKVREAREALYQSLRGFWVVDIPRHRLVFLLICTLLDPRLIRLRLPLMTAETRAMATQAFIDEFALNWAPLATKPTSDYESGDEEDGVDDVPLGVEKSCGVFKPAGMGSFGDFIASMEAHGNIPDEPIDKDQAKPELGEAEKYLASDPASMDTDILVWWAQHKSTYPNLSRMARQFLSVPATSASAERVFSLAGRIFSDLAQNMNDTTLEDRMWAKVNRKQVLK